MSFLNKLASKAAKTASGAAKTAAEFAAIGSETIVFEEFPMNFEALKARPESDLKDPYAVAALTVAALCVYPEDKDAAIEMLNFLKGPSPLSENDKRFLKDRFSDKDYVPASYFAGSKPENNYTPDEPFSITVKAHPYSVTEENYISLQLVSGGADSPRAITLRCKPSTGEWFAWNYEGLLMGIRVPVAENPWA
ncbi:MAG: hypothetical protein MJ137_01010 [Clostridia bacterium]|nr:hypothetical protein [Clostridia bacterium]